jgi:hypothetical protein
VMHICVVNDSHDYHAKNSHGENYNCSSRDEAMPDKPLILKTIF